jgi:hypothetical protein
VAEKTKGLVRRFPMGAANAVRELKTRLVRTWFL